jgi:hypothetical protein
VFRNRLLKWQEVKGGRKVRSKKKRVIELRRMKCMGY